MLQRYLLNTSGNFGIMFSVIMGMLVLGVGAAIDASGITKEKARVQLMSDAATLAAAASGAEDLEGLKAVVEASLKANNYGDIDYEWDLSLTEDGITLVVDSSYNAHLMGMVGKDTFEVNALSAAPIGGIGALNLALVLDSTLSMQGENMTNLQIAATNLVDAVEDSGDDVHLSVVPFATYVKVDTQYETANWTDIPAPYNVQKTERNIVNPGLCRTEDYIRYQDDQPINATREVCDEAAYGPDIVINENRVWEGCMGSRSGLHRTYPEHGSRPISGINHYNCGTTLLPLTDDYIAVRDRINALEARDETYIPAGLMWGWRTLDEQLPFNEASLLGGGRERAMILMSDGHNIKAQGTRLPSERERPEADAFHEEPDGERGDQFTAELCRNIKADGIRIFVIAYRVTGAETVNTHNTLRNCATNIDDFYDAQDGVQLDAAFQNIGNSFSTVRLSR